MAKTKSVELQLREILNEYNKHVQDVTNNSIRDISKEAVQKLRNTSPKRTGAYARSWTLKKLSSYGGIDDVVVHNSKHYQLTHLLENGHVIRNKKGNFGRTNGIKHIAPVAEWADNELQSKIERDL